MTIEKSLRYGRFNSVMFSVTLLTFASEYTSQGSTLWAVLAVVGSIGTAAEAYQIHTQIKKLQNQGEV